MKNLNSDLDLYSKRKVKRGEVDNANINEAFLNEAVYPFCPDIPDLDVIIGFSFKPYENQPCDGQSMFFIRSIDESGNKRKIEDLIKTSDLASHPFIKYDDKGCEKSIEFNGKSDNQKAIRKLLQSTGTSNEVCQKYSLLFMQDIKDTNGEITPDIPVGIIEKDLLIDKCGYMVDIIGLGKFNISLYFNAKIIPLFGYNCGFYCGYISANKNKICENCRNHKKCKLLTNIKDTLDSFSKDHYKFFHGTSVVVFGKKETAKQEAERLSRAGRGTYVNNRSSKDIIHTTNEYNILDAIGSIDGGFIFDSDGFLYAYGVIFDGEVPTPTKDYSYTGDVGKGSRHNSMKLYIHNINKKGCIAAGFVFSEDGGCTKYCEKFQKYSSKK